MDKNELDDIEVYDVNINELDREATLDYIPGKRKSIFHKIIKEILSWFTTIFMAFIIAFFINIVILRPSEVSGTSMVPTLSNGENVFISKLPFLFHQPNRGDIIVLDKNVNRPRTTMIEIKDTFKYNIFTKSLFNEDTNDFWIKRVIGISGDIIEFKDDKVFRNNIELIEDYINTGLNKRYPNGTKIEVKKGYIFVMGDNRGDSKDSRSKELGQVPLQNIIGKLVFHKTKA